MPDARRGDWWRFFLGQGISVLGSAFTAFALPLLIYQRTGSPVNLALAFAAGRLPYLIFGLVGGAYADRTDRKRLMIGAAILQGAVVASIPALDAAGRLPLWWLYATGFIGSALGILADAAGSAAVPSLVPREQIVEANGRLLSWHTAAYAIGPPLAGLATGVLPLASLLLFDAFSYVVAASLLAAIRTSFNADRVGPRGRPTIRGDIAEGLRYVWNHPVLRSAALFAGLLNLLGAVVLAEVVVFAKERLGATNFQYGLLVAAGMAGVSLSSLLAGPLRQRFPFGVLSVGTRALADFLTLACALTSNFWVALPIWMVRTGLTVIPDICIISLRQMIVPDYLLGRVVTFNRVIGQSTAPIGALLGAALIARTDVALVYGLSGALCCLVSLLFARSPLGHADDYLTHGAGDAAPATG